MSRCRHVSVVCVFAKCGLVVVGGCWWLLEVPRVRVRVTVRVEIVLCMQYRCRDVDM